MQISAGTCQNSNGCCWNPDSGKNINCNKCTNDPVNYKYNDDSTIDSPWLTQCSEDEDYFNTLNHEIDIELPANYPQYAQRWKDWLNHCDWNTWNANTWIADNNWYDGTTVWYTQAEAKTCAPNIMEHVVFDVKNQLILKQVNVKKMDLKKNHF